MDLSKLSNEDLDALEAGDLTKLSDAGLALLEGTPAAPSGPDQTTRTERVLRGVVDPVNAGAQLLTHLLPKGVVDAGNKANNWLADQTGLVARLPEGGVDQQLREEEQAFQQKRGEQGGKFDGYRLAGNVLSPANLAVSGKAMQLGARGAQLAGLTGLGARAASGAITGAAAGSMAAPVQGKDEDFWAEKAKQAALGAAFGGAAPVVGAAASRIVSPRASTNPQLRALTDRGVQPTVGQALGGMANRIEEKATMIPIAGDMIAARRAGAQQQFNTAAINEALEPLRAVQPQLGRVEGAGFGAVDDAHQAISSAYQQAKQQIGHVRLDNQFYQDVAQLRQLTTGLTPPFQQRFDRLLRDTVQSRSRQGVMTAETFKRVDADLGEMAARFGKSPTAAGKEFGDAVQQLQGLLNQQGYRSNPQAQTLLDAADGAFARLVRIEDAAKRAGNQSGQFTPGQLNQAVRSADRSARGNQFARGQALMQDLSDAGQSVLGNRVPDSGTAGRLALGGLGLSAGALHPGIPAAMVGGAAMYTRPMQNLLRGAVTARPQVAQPIAGALERAAPYLAAPAGAVGGLQALE